MIRMTWSSDGGFRPIQSKPGLIDQRIKFCQTMIRHYTEIRVIGNTWPVAIKVLIPTTFVSAVLHVKALEPADGIV
jgi:hypothetical protein